MSATGLGARRRDEVPWLLLAALLAAAGALLETPLAVRLPLGLAAVLLLPGYALASLLFPRAEELDGVERLALGLGLSMALVAVLALALNATPWGLQPRPIVLSTTAWTVGAAAGAWWRRGRLGAEERAGLPAGFGSWRAASRPTRLALLGLAGSAGLAGAALWATLTAPPPPFTELYMVGPEGRAENYPRAAAPGERVGVTVGVVNREGEAAGYRLEVESGGTVLAERGPIELAAGAGWEQRVEFALPKVGQDQAVNLLLYRDGATEPYRRLRLWLDVAVLTPTGELPAMWVAATTPTPGPTPSGTAERREELRELVVDAPGYGAWLRAEPGRAGAIRRGLTDGSRVLDLGREATADGMTWRTVRLENGEEGWVAGELLRSSEGGTTDGLD